MLNTYYLINELTQRKRRSLINILIITTAVAILIFVGLLTDSLQKAFHAPLTDIGASLTVQKSGDVPETMSGPVLPCSVAPITANQIHSIKSIPGVQNISEAILFWDFQPNSFNIVVGFNPEDNAGPALLRKALDHGNLFNKNDNYKALADLTWATSNTITIGNLVNIAGRDFEIIGIVDSSKISKIATGQLYIPLNEAKNIAHNSPGVTKTHNFGTNDANILFIKADRNKIDQISTEIKKISGKKIVISSPYSFKKMLGGLFSLTNQFAGLISGLALIASLLLIAVSTTAGIKERIKEIGIVKTIGWTKSDITTQLAAELFTIIFIGTSFGISIGLLGSWLVSFQTISIPIPWDMAPTPHFLPGGEEQLEYIVQLIMPSPTKHIAIGIISALAIGIISLIISITTIVRLKPSEVLRNE